MIVEAFKNRPVNIGRLGENEARIISFPVGDMQSEFSGCSFLVLNRRKGDPSAYPVPAANCTVEYDHLYWTVMSGDVAKEGSGECQIVAILNNKVMKSDIYMTVTGRALDGAGTPPDPWAGWATYVAQRVLDAEAYAIGTREGIPVDEEDPTYHNNSKYWAEYAGGMLNTKADKADTVLTTTLSRGRKSGTTVGSGSLAFGTNVEASGTYSHAEGEETSATRLDSHAEGYMTKATAQRAHAEGYNSRASGDSSHVEGSGNVASGSSSHAEGTSTLASGLHSHSEGNTTTASGMDSHAEGSHTIANHRSQHVLGEYNVEDDSSAVASSRGNYIEIVGNGTNSTKSNARSLDWDGNERLRGNLYVGCNRNSSGGTKVATVTEVAAKLDASMKGSANGVAELDGNGKIPSSQLPSYVDDILEYDTVSDFPPVGESGKIYVALDTNMTYRWGRIEYVQIKGDLALGETSQTAYRGDRGKAAYDHAVAKGSAFASGFYKITTNSEGHVTEVTAVEKSDITALGVRGEDVATVEDTEAMMEEYEEEVVA